MTDKFTNIIYEKRDGVAYVTLNRPQVHNALNHATLIEIKSAFEAINADDTGAWDNLTGAGEKAFAAGADISEMQHDTSIIAEERFEFWSKRI